VSNFSSILAAYRRQRGLTKLSLARLSGIHPSQVSRFERGLRPPIEAIHRIASALNVPPAELADAAFADISSDDDSSATER